MNNIYGEKYTNVTCTNNDWLISRVKILNIILKYLDFKIEDSILEIGCDDGFMQKALEDKLFNVIGIDINKEALNNNKCSKVYYMNATKLDFDNESFNKIFSSHTVEHIDDLNMSFKEVDRVLKTGGLYLAIYPWELFRGMAAVRAAIKVNGNPFDSRKHHLHKLNPKKINKFLKCTRLKQIDSKLFFANTPQYVSIFKKI